MRVITLLPCYPFMQNSKKTFSYWGNCTYPIRKISCRQPVAFFEEAITISNVLWMFFAGILLMLVSCSTSKNTIYFKDLPKDTTLHNIITENFDLKIQKGDLLSIAVASLSPDVAFYNAPQNTIGPASGYSVDNNGNINFIKLGVLHVEGMTRKNLKDSLEKALVPYLKDAVVSVGFLNRHITIIGAVSPQVLPMPGDNMTILDALASSGDIGQKGKINNVLVIRDSSGSKEFKRLNLEDHSVFYSPYYYMQPNDIVYVEPARVKTTITAPQIISYVTSGITLIFLIIDRIVK